MAENRGERNKSTGREIQMGITELILIAVGLAMDAFAVAVCKGLSMNRINYKHTFIIALFFGAFQGIMPTIGWALGRQFADYISNIDHWIVFILLAFIGGKMIYEALHEDEEQLDACTSVLDIKELFLLAIATSIDALAVGISFAFLGVEIVSSALLITATTFSLSFVGVIIGSKFGSMFQKKAEIAGGIILIIIGIKVLIEHLFM